MSSNSVTTVTILKREYIEMLIENLPLQNQELSVSSLDELIHLTKGYPFSSPRFRFHYSISTRRIVINLISFLGENPIPSNVMARKQYATSNIPFIIHDLSKKFGKEKEVIELMEIQNIQNLMNI